MRTLSATSKTYIQDWYVLHSFHYLEDTQYSLCENTCMKTWFPVWKENLQLYYFLKPVGHETNHIYHVGIYANTLSKDRTMSCISDATFNLLRWARPKRYTLWGNISWLSFIAVSLSVISRLGYRVVEQKTTPFCLSSIKWAKTMHLAKITYEKIWTRIFSERAVLNSNFP